MTPTYMLAYTADDVEDLARDLAAQMAAHAEETDPHWRAVLAEHIADDARWLAEMREAVFPALPFIPPLGLPAPMMAEGGCVMTWNLLHLLHLLPATVCGVAGMFFVFCLIGDVQAGVARTRDIVNASALSMAAWAGAAVSLWGALT
jgi:hypothetical protein